MNQSMPVVFISHGPPTILLMKTPVADFLKNLGQEVPSPQAILCVSAHWETVVPTLTSAPKPGIIHDFGGPPRLFREEYKVNGSQSLAEEAMELLKDKGQLVQLDTTRGLDHGVWVPLKLMFPEADVPVVQLSIQTDKDSRFHFALGQALKPLCQKGVLIIGSGGAVHNLDEIHEYQLNDVSPDYVHRFDGWLNEMLTKGSIESLLDYKQVAPDPERSHPFPAEHFLPLFVCLGAGEPEAKVQRIHHGFMYGTLSMAAYRWD